MLAATQNNQTYLPAEPNQAMQALIRISKKLLDLAEREMQSLTLSDMLTFAVLQDEKQHLAQRYSFMSREFRSRIEEFRKTDKGTLDMLDALQGELGEKMRENNRVVQKIRSLSHQNTQSTLFTAQELGNERPVAFERETKVVTGN